MQESTPEVVVAGAGPVGLMLAAELRLAGVDVLLVERRPTGTTGESRAPGISARTMEVFAQRGLAEEFRRRGKELPFVVFAAIPMDPRSVDPGWPSALILPQHETEAILLDRVQELEAPVRWSTTVAGVDQDEEGVTVGLTTPSGPETVRAHYLVGCDGGRSTVRRSTGIAFPGLAPQTWWVVGDLDLAVPPDPREAFGHNDLVGYYQLSQAEPGWHRLSLMCREPPDDPSRPVTLDEVRRTMVDGLGTDHGLRGARWMSRWSDGFHHAATYRDRRVLLAGDAAHTHTPIGGQGLNIGIQDALNLGWKLAAVLRGDAGDALLDSYHEERWPVAAAALRQSMTQTELVKPGPRRVAIRDVFADLLANPAVVTQLSGELSGLTVRYPVGDGHPLLGRRMPNLSLSDASRLDAPTDEEAGATDVFTLLREPGYLLVELAGARTQEAPADRAGHVRVVSARYDPERRGDLWHLPVLGDVAPFDAVLVRPDGYVAWVQPAALPLDPDGLDRALGLIPQRSEEPVAGPATGTWDLSFTTPGGDRRAVLVLCADGTGWRGTYDDTPVADLVVDGGSVQLTSKIKSPFPTRVRWSGVIDGDTMAGEAKASFMTLPFTAVRRA